MVRRWKIDAVEGPFLGQDLEASRSRIDPRFTDTSQNTEYYKGQLINRKGFTQAHATAITNTPTIHSVMDYHDSGGTQNRLLTGASSIYSLGGNPATNPPVALTLPTGYSMTADKRWNSVEHDGIIYMGNGTDGGLKYDGTTVTRDGITTPTTTGSYAEGVAAGDAVAVGKHFVKWRYANVTNGTYSDFSPATSVTITTTSKDIDVTGLPTSIVGIEQAEEKWLYMTLAGTTTPYYRTHTVSATASTTTIAITDTDLAASLLAVESGVAPNSSIQVFNNNRRIVASGETVYWSEVDTLGTAFLENFPSSNFVQYKTTGDTNITGMFPWFNETVILKRFNMGVMFGQTNKNMRIDHMFSQFGCLGHRTIQKVTTQDKAFACWLSDDGVVVYEGGTPKIASKGRLDSFFRDTLYLPDRAQFCSRVSHARDTVYWYVRVSSTGNNNHAIFYNYVTGAVGAFTFPGVASAGNYVDATTAKIEGMAGAYSVGRVYTLDSGSDDNGTDIAFKHRIPFRFQGEKARVKRYDHVDIYFASAVVATATVRWYMDWDTTDTGSSSANMNTAAKMVRVPINRRGKSIAIQLEFTGAVDIEIEGVELSYDFAGFV